MLIVFGMPKNRVCAWASETCQYRLSGAAGMPPVRTRKWFVLGTVKLVNPPLETGAWIIYDTSTNAVRGTATLVEKPLEMVINKPIQPTAVVMAVVGVQNASLPPRLTRSGFIVRKLRASSGPKIIPCVSCFLMPCRAIVDKPMETTTLPNYL
jgi:hypothetical protein